MSNIWRHKKTGGLYVIVQENAVIEKTMELATIYSGLSDGKLWIRPSKEFYDGRFENINKIEYEKNKVTLSVSTEF